MDDVAPVSSAPVSVIAADDLSLRYFFILQARWNSEQRAGAAPIGIDRIYGTLGGSQKAASYVDPLAAFYTDVTIPFTTRGQLPVVALTEPLSVLDSLAGRPVEINIQAINMHWGRNVANVAPLKTRAMFKDSITFFDSGHMVYAPALLLSEASNVMSAQHLTVLTSLVGTPGVTYHQDLDDIRAKVQFRFEGDADWKSLAEFMTQRLAGLCSASGMASVFDDLIKPSLEAAGWNRERCKTALAGIAKVTWEDLRSASIEVVGARRHSEIKAWCEAAKVHKISSGSGERAIAALGQNVLDAENQDEREVADSLSQAVMSNYDVLLIHPSLTVLYSPSSRSFDEMRDGIGGCPYVMLTNVILAYNEYMLNESAKLIDRIKRTSGGAKKASTPNDIRADLEMRGALFANQTWNVLPNIFRYPAERQMFDEVEKQRGLKRRAEEFDQFSRKLSELRQGHAELAEREQDRRINLLLLALGMFQISGIFIAALGLDVVKNGGYANWLWAGVGLSFLVALKYLAQAWWPRARRAV
jgi:hypothetical protein